MRVIVAGSRDIICTTEILNWIIEEYRFKPSVILSGGARGADRIGELWAEQNGVPIERYSPDWNQYGKRAGMIRNDYMAQRADSLIALWDGQSPGTKNMIERAKKRGLKYHVWMRESRDNV